MTALPFADALSALRHHAARRPEAPALEWESGWLSYGELAAAVDRYARTLFRRRDLRCGLLLDNGPAWVIFDLAARAAGIVLVPIPTYFSVSQIRHAIRSAGLDLLITDQAPRFQEIFDRAPPILDLGLDIAPEVVALDLPPGAPASRAALPAGGRKVTFTSGTTGAPKGGCLADGGIDRVARSLHEASGARGTDRHLCLLPLATLLENIAGVDVPLLAGAVACVPKLATVGLSGSSQADMRVMAGAIDGFQATTIVTVPQLLQGLIAIAAAGAWQPKTLRLVAVGGAPLPAGTIEKARALGLPAFEGYGLSELSSVVAFNRPGADRPGSVGRPLPHAEIKLASDGEVLVRGSVFAGYLGAEPEAGRQDMHNGFWSTGDLGRFDAEGYLHLTGRKKNMFITAFGRNVAPEWVECELTGGLAIGQAAVFGEARPWNAAVIVPRKQGPGVETQVAADIQRANARLPDYARVQRWIFAEAPFTAAAGELTGNGRLRRAAILARYGARLERLYQEEAAHVL